MQKKLFLASVLIAACQSQEPAPAALSPVSQGAPGAAVPAAQVTLSPQFVEKLREIAASYQASFHRGLYPLKGPLDCQDPHMPRKQEEEVKEAKTKPTGKNYPAIKLSSSPDNGAHGTKLYYLFVSNQDAYQKSLSGAPSPDGQSVVKESWYPKELPQGSTMPAVPEGTPSPYFVDGDKLLKANEPAGLFIMYKLPSDTPDTDGGWVYGTLSSTGEVTSAGRVASCMRCHQEAPSRLLSKPSI